MKVNTEMEEMAAFADRKLFSSSERDKEKNTKNSCQLTNSEREIIKMCRKIRSYAVAGKVNIDKAATPHDSGSDSLHLKKFVELCGISFREFILQYLCNLQPFQLELDKEQQFGKHVRCVLDLSYSIALYLKIEFSYELLIVSFHENQRRKNKKYAFLQNSLTYAFSKTNYPVGETVLSPIRLAHGFLVFEPELFCKVVDIDLVKFRLEDMSEELLKFVNIKVDDLIESSNQSEIFSSIKQASITSFGETILNEISILVDALMIRSISSGRRQLLFTSLNNKMFELLSLPNSEDYLNALKERYSAKLGDLVKKQRTLLGLDE